MRRSIPQVIAVSVVIAAAVLVVGCGARLTRETDQGGHPICRDWRGQRIYDCEKNPADAIDAEGRPDPFGIAPPRPVSGVVQVPGPIVTKAVEDLTPEDRAWLAWKAGP